MNVFDRWRPARHKTFAFLKFCQHQTHLNHMYWAHEAAFRGAFRLTKGISPAEKADQLFPNPTSKRKRDITLEKWAEDYNGFDNWTRLSAVIAMSGYFEIFLRTIIEAACQSCPGVLIGAHRSVDGVSLLKRRSNYCFDRRVEPCVKGDWRSRVEAYKSLFDDCPQYLLDNLSTLDDLRQVRNSVGHSFGRQLSYPVIGKDTLASEMKKIKHDKLVLWMGVVHKSAKAIDSHLGSGFVGSYESIAVYHYWDCRDPGNTNELREFAQYLHKETGWPHGPQYRRAMVDFYSRA